MALQVASLNSGSNGNCYYIGNETEAVFVDAGLSCRETERRMKSLDLDMHRVKAIFISHEHTDHICGLYRLAVKYNMPVFVTPRTLVRSRVPLPPQLVCSFEPGVAVELGALSVLPFAKHHDGCDPHSFLIGCGGVRIGVLTDIGRVCEEVAHHFAQCDAAFLEANYDEEMLEQGRYPQRLKKRIRGGRGHLSNSEALALFQQRRPEGMRLLLLSHLSKENNDPALALQCFLPHASDTEVVVASRYGPSEVYQIDARDPAGRCAPRVSAPEVPAQLALF